MSVSANDIIKIMANEYASYRLTDPEDIKYILASGNLAGKNNGETQNIKGEFIYKFNVDLPGWYVFSVESDRSDGQTAFGYKHSYVLDDTFYLNGSGYWGASSEKIFKVGNVWLSAGAHSLKIANYYWTGFHPITELNFVPAEKTLSKRVHIVYSRDEYFNSGYFRTGEEININILADGDFKEKPSIIVIDQVTGKNVRKIGINIPKSKEPTIHTFHITTLGLPEGSYAIRLAANNRLVQDSDVRSIYFDLIDTDTSKKEDNSFTLDKQLVKNGLINCADEAILPNFSNLFSTNAKQATKIVRTNNMVYRQSGDTGFHQHLNANDPSWFAYKLPYINSNVPYVNTRKAYLLEVDYPDDAWRSFTISLRENREYDLIIGTGIDSGGVYNLTHSLLTHRMFFWPKENGSPVVTFQNVRDRSTAACSEIRLYELQNYTGLPELDIKNNNGRHFGYWFEEHDRWATMFGATMKSKSEYRQAAERWAQLVRYLGGDTLMVSAKTYAFGLYPSRTYNLTDISAYTLDLLKMLLLVAEKYGLKVVVDLHPRAIELEWQESNEEDQSDIYLVDYNGDTWKTVKAGSQKRGNRLQQPRFNPLATANKKWLGGMVEEIANRYKDYPAFKGISLRVMHFESRSLFDLHSIYWGYGNYNIRQFAADTGIDLMDYDYSIRYKLLTGRYTQDWENWRGEKISDLLRGILDNIHRQRDDLKLYINLIGSLYFPVENPKQAGFDIQALKNIAKLEVMNGRKLYGRYSRNKNFNQSIVSDVQRHEKNTKNSTYEKLDLTALQQKRNAHLIWAHYIEDGGATVPRDQIGFLSGKNPWLSAHSQPAGRSALQRYALTLAETDTNFIINGGNGYSFDQPLIREFLQEFRNIPDQPFSRLSSENDLVAVWALQTKDTYFFYIVNRSGYDVTTELYFSKDNEVERLSSQEKIILKNKRYKTVLKPFQVLAFKAQNNQLVNADSTILNSEQINIKQKINWLKNLVKELNKGPQQKLKNSEVEQLDTHVRNLEQLILNNNYLGAIRTLYDAQIVGILLKLGEESRIYLDNWKFSTVAQQ